MKGNPTEWGEGCRRLRVCVERDHAGRIKQVSRNFKGTSAKPRPPSPS
jgi:hypothetical protein